MASKRLNPYRDAGPFGVVTIGGVDIPGTLQSINGIDVEQDWNFQKGSGGGGAGGASPGEGVKAAPVANNAGSFAVSVWRGAKLAEEIPIVSVIANEDQYDAALDFIKHMLPKRGRKPPSHALVNPEANAVGITRCSVRRCGAPREDKPGSGKRIFTVVVVEYNPQKTAPAGQADPAKPPDEPSPADAQEQELKDLMDKTR